MRAHPHGAQRGRDPSGDVDVSLNVTLSFLHPDEGFRLSHKHTHTPEGSAICSSLSATFTASLRSRQLSVAFRRRLKVWFNHSNLQGRPSLRQTNPRTRKKNRYSVHGHDGNGRRKLSYILMGRFLMCYWFLFLPSRLKQVNKIH